MPLPGAQAEPTLWIAGSLGVKRQRLNKANSPNYSVACTPSLAPNRAGFLSDSSQRLRPDKFLLDHGPSLPEPGRSLLTLTRPRV